MQPIKIALYSVVSSIFLISMWFIFFTNCTDASDYLARVPIRDGSRQKNYGDEISRENTNNSFVKNTIKTQSNSGSQTNKAIFKIPNIFHFVWFYKKTKKLSFVYSLSILSVYKHQNPDVIYFHTNSEPIGEYWDQVKTIPTLKINYTEPVKKLKGKLVPKNDFSYKGFPTSDSNIHRMHSVYEMGGVYFDLDVLLVRSIDPLRKYSCVLGVETDTGRLCGGIIFGERHAPFLDLWVQSFLDDYRKDSWAYNTGTVPTKLAKEHPDLIHLEKTRLNRPSYNELDQIFGNKIYDWENNYTVHLWHTVWKNKIKEDDITPETIKTMKTTFGQLARKIYYGTSAIIHE